MQFLFFISGLVFAKQIKNDIDKGSQNWTFETNDAKHLLVYRTTVKSPAVAARCRPKGRMADLT